MLKTVVLVLAGLAAGLAIAFSLAPSSPPIGTAPDSAGFAPSARTQSAVADGATGRLAALEEAFAAEVDQRVALEAQVAELTRALEALGQRPQREAGPPQFADGGDPGPAAIERRARAAGVPPAQSERRFVDQLVAAGFAPDRAEWILRRSEELRMETLQAQYDAQRGGRPPEPRGPAQTLRSELGDTDYERYLKAVGRPAAVPVRDVLASSPAERSGLQPGDEIVAYGGKRVFDMRELNELTLEGTPGESVVVDVRRDGQTVQLVMPRGPIGIFGGGFRGR